MLNRTHIILATAILTLGLMATPLAQKIAVLDSQRVVNSTNAAKKAVKELTAARDAAQKKVKKLEKPLLEKRNALEEKKSVLSQEDFLKEQGKLRNDVRSFRLEAQTIQEDLERKNLTFRKKISDTVREVVAEYAKEKGYDIVLPKALLLYATDATDISDAVLARTNKKLGK